MKLMFFYFEDDEPEKEKVIVEPVKPVAEKLEDLMNNVSHFPAGKPKKYKMPPTYKTTSEMAYCQLSSCPNKGKQSERAKMFQDGKFIFDTFACLMKFKDNFNLPPL